MARDASGRAVARRAYLIHRVQQFGAAAAVRFERRHAGQPHPTRERGGGGGGGVRRQATGVTAAVGRRAAAAAARAAPGTAVGWMLE